MKKSPIVYITTAASCVERSGAIGGTIMIQDNNDPWQPFCVKRVRGPALSENCQWRSFIKALELVRDRYPQRKTIIGVSSLVIVQMLKKLSRRFEEFVGQQWEEFEERKTNGRRFKDEACVVKALYLIYSLPHPEFLSIHHASLLLNGHVYAGERGLSRADRNHLINGRKRAKELARWENGLS